MPNWNSCTIPVTTPRAKLIRKSFPKNFDIRKYSGFRERYHAVCIPATRNDKPSVNGTKMKW
jgi:hypothetical protein